MARWAGRLVLVPHKAAIIEYFTQHERVKQFAFSKGGAEAAFAHVQRHLEINPTHLVGGNDLQSAYNEGDRSAMWDLLEGVPGLAGILAYVVAVYGVVASIVLERPGIGPLRVKNGTGYRQGCALAALLFCLVLHGTLLDVAARNPGLYISAFVDDTKFLGDVATVPAALGTHATLASTRSRPAAP